MHIDDAGLASEGGANGQAVSTVNMEITGRRESQRSEEKTWMNRRKRQEKNSRLIKRDGGAAYLVYRPRIESSLIPRWRPSFLFSEHSSYRPERED